MSRIYDALERAREEGRTVAEPLSPPSVSLPVSPEKGAADLDMEQEMLTLYHMITATLPQIDHPTILFIGSRSNEGTSTITRELAKVVSLRLDKKVLLIDFDRSRPEHHVYANLKPEAAASEGDGNKEDLVRETLCRVEESSLYVMPLFLRTMATPRTLESAKGSGFWDPIRDQFDLVLVDGPPATTFPDGPGLASQVDGVILVVEAEKTRWQVALSVKEKIVKSGGSLLGVVFNKRRQYIPEFIYRHL